MQIEVNSDRSVQGNERLTQYVQQTVEAGLGRFSDQLTRVQAHLSDENSHKAGGNDKRCMVEARPRGMPPVAVTHLADNMDQAIIGAIDKMERVLDDTFTRLREAKGRSSPAREESGDIEE